MKSNLFLRVVSALVLAPVVIGAIVFGGTAYNVLLACVGAFMATEWETMIKGHQSFVAVSLCLMTSMIVFLTSDGQAIFALIAIPAFAVFLYLKTHHSLLSFGSFYMGVPLFSLSYIAYYTDSGEGDLNYSALYVLWVLFAVWATDIGGYVIGKSIGGPKLCPKYSPKKTWAGLIGGMAFSAITTYIFVITMNHYYESKLKMGMLVLSAVILAFISQVGDLFESRIKRSLGLKDSGNLIPGHGGIFDRVDGLLFACPVVALFVWLDNLGVLQGLLK